MKVITKRDKVDRFVDMMSTGRVDRDLGANLGERKLTRLMIDRLPRPLDPVALGEIVGHHHFWIVCDNCKRTVESAMRVQERVPYECDEIALCLNCLKGAVTELENQQTQETPTSRSQ